MEPWFGKGNARFLAFPLPNHGCFILTFSETLIMHVLMNGRTDCYSAFPPTSGVFLAFVKYGVRVLYTCGDAT